jgi:hypothetical protein
LQITISGGNPGRQRQQNHYHQDVHVSLLWRS